MIVHGIDYNGNGLYDSVLDRSELDRHLPGEATAPALCGPLVPPKNQKADAGGTAVYTASLQSSRPPRTSGPAAPSRRPPAAAGRQRAATAASGT